MENSQLKNTHRCQSCGMPISPEFANLGTMSDGSFHSEYCNICFQKGDFTKPQLTLQQMINSSINNMVNQIGMPQEQAEQLARSFIPTLKRWSQTN